MDMEATANLLHMKGGTGELSYANNSLIQRKAISNAKPIMEEAIKEVYFRLLPKTLSISDMGCSSGPNTFYAVFQLVEAIVEAHEESPPPEFLIHLNDLPSNDFNTVFRLLPKFQEILKKKHVGITCYLSAVPGSFYDRLFPSQSLHFVHSSNSLHWLSHAPDGAHGNKGNIYISSTSPPNVINAYLKQFKKDFSGFLRHRAMELVTGGSMVLSIVGRRLEDPTAWDSQNILGPLSKTINNMVNEGLIEEEKLDLFNVPLYYPSVQELKGVIEEEGSFIICRLGMDEIHWNGDEKELSTPDLLRNAGLNVAKTLRAVFEPLLATQFGENIMDEMFSRYAQTLSDCMSKEKTEIPDVIVSLKKKD